MESCNVKFIKAFLPLAFLCLACLFVGCSSSNAPIMPKEDLTPEQLEKIKKEDRAIEQEESQGSIKK